MLKWLQASFSSNVNAQESRIELLLATHVFSFIRNSNFLGLRMSSQLLQSILKPNVS